MDENTPELLPAAWLWPATRPASWVAMIARRLAALAQPDLEWRTRASGELGLCWHLPFADGTVATVELIPAPDQVRLAVWTTAWSGEDDITYKAYVALLHSVADHLLDQVLCPADPSASLHIQSFADAQAGYLDDGDELL